MRCVTKVLSRTFRPVTLVHQQASFWSSGGGGVATIWNCHSFDRNNLSTKTKSEGKQRSLNDVQHVLVMVAAVSCE